MSIKKYTNFEAVNNKTENEGKYLQAEDIFIVTKNEIEETEFGECKYDVMEVSVTILIITYYHKNLEIMFPI